MTNGLLLLNSFFSSRDSDELESFDWLGFRDIDHSVGSIETKWSGNKDASYLVAPLMKTELIEIPTPEAETTMISTSSRFRLKYWATISVDTSLTMPTPMPAKKWENETTPPYTVHTQFDFTQMMG